MRYSLEDLNQPDDIECQHTTPTGQRVRMTFPRKKLPARKILALDVTRVYVAHTPVFRVGDKEKRDFNSISRVRDTRSSSSEDHKQQLTPSPLITTLIG